MKIIEIIEEIIINENENNESENIEMIIEMK